MDAGPRRLMHPKQAARSEDPGALEEGLAPAIGPVFGTMSIPDRGHMHQVGVVSKGTARTTVNVFRVYSEPHALT